METFLLYILMGFIIAFVICAIAVITIILIQRKKVNIKEKWKEVDKGQFFKEVLPAFAMLGFVIGVLIWSSKEDVSTLTLIVLIGIPGALLANLK